MGIFVLLAACVALQIFSEFSPKDPIMRRLFLDTGIHPQKKKVIKALPLYNFGRKIMLILFLAIYYTNAAYMACLGLIFTVFLSSLIFWFEPFVNKQRYYFTLICEGGFFLLMLLIFIYVCNPYMSSSARNALSGLIIFEISLLVVVECAYPIWYLYGLAREGVDREECLDNIREVREEEK